MNKTLNYSIKACFVLALSIVASASTMLPTGDYASLAIDARNGEFYGWAVNYASYAEADNRALEECRKRGGNCHVVLNFKGGSGVYVVEEGNPYLYGWGVGANKTEAENIAMAEARAQGGSKLLVRVWGCNETPTVQDTVYQALPYKGVFGFYFIKSDDDKKCFITRAYYMPGAAQLSGEKWVFTSDAETRMTPQAQKFLDAVEDNLYGYLGDLKDKVITQHDLDWNGMNEVEITNHTLNYDSVAERKTIIENSIQRIKESMKNSGYEVVEVPI
ncbi:DUF4189 domain-containing protein [bacterium]|nr:DUF4189 domain-containing protein [bacterium]